jgi:hypothetical protein
MGERIERKREAAVRGTLEERRGMDEIAVLVERRGLPDFAGLPGKRHPVIYRPGSRVARPSPTCEPKDRRPGRGRTPAIGGHQSRFLIIARRASAGGINQLIVRGWRCAMLRSIEKYGNFAHAKVGAAIWLPSGVYSSPCHKTRK